MALCTVEWTMDHVIAVAAELADGSCQYFVTWGRIQDVVGPEPVCKVLEPFARRCVRGELVRLRVCETLREAAESSEAPYFFEALTRYSVTAIPFGDGYEEWRSKMAAEMKAGREIYFCGLPAVSPA